MTFREEWAEGPEDAPSPELVTRLARALWAAEIHEPEVTVAGWEVGLTVADRERFLELADAQVRAGEQHRAVCQGWGDGAHSEEVVIRPGLEPVSHSMCEACSAAFATS